MSLGTTIRPTITLKLPLGEQKKTIMTDMRESPCATCCGQGHEPSDSKESGLSDSDGKAEAQTQSLSRTGGALGGPGAHVYQGLRLQSLRARLPDKRQTGLLTPLSLTPRAVCTMKSYFA